VASEEALAEFQASGHRYREGVMLTNLARIAVDSGRLDDALDGGHQALRLTEDIDDAEGVAASLHSLGDSYRLLGDLPTAREYLDRGLEQSRKHALPYFTTHVLASLAAVDLAEGDVDAAVAHARQAQEEASGAEVPHAGARADLVAGMARYAAGDPDAVRLLRAAVARCVEFDIPADRLESLSVLSVALLDAGELPAAVEVAEQVLPELDGPVAPGVVQPGRVLVDVHRVLTAAGDPRAADVARRAAAYLQQQSERVRDEERRARFLALPVNVDLAGIAASVDR